MARQAWVTRTVVGIIVATLFSDVGHEMVTAVLPLYLGTLGLGTAALGLMEGAADLAFSLSKLAGGAVGHRVAKKRPWATAGYALTTLGTGLIATTQLLAAMISFRTAAWFGRGFRSPLRDFLLADEVGPTHFGRAYGLERTADMIGAVIGPLVAAGLVALGASFRTVILVSVVPSLVSVIAIGAFTRDRVGVPAPAPAEAKAPLPRAFWLFTAGVLLFGLGDFSRTFLIVIAALALGGDSQGLVSAIVLLYAGHNLVSAFAAYPAGKLGDATSKTRVLIAGYALGVVTNLVFAFGHASLPLVIVAIALSGIYIAIEETLEKAVVAELLPRAQRSLGLGILASANALGDFASTLFVGLMLEAGHVTAAFAAPAAVGAAGVAWMLVIRARAIVR
ncbi:MAG: MFS transporter [Myxococcales bacterium]|nr:MFS transporter [Myxococcales bacterium]